MSAPRRPIVVGRPPPPNKNRSAALEGHRGKTAQPGRQRHHRPSPRVIRRSVPFGVRGRVGPDSLLRCLTVRQYARHATVAIASPPRDADEDGVALRRDGFVPDLSASARAIGRSLGSNRLTPARDPLRPASGRQSRLAPVCRRADTRLERRSSIPRTHLGDADDLRVRRPFRCLFQLRRARSDSVLEVTRHRSLRTPRGPARCRSPRTPDPFTACRPSRNTPAHYAGHRLRAERRRLSPIARTPALRNDPAAAPGCHRCALHVTPP